jgi:hypothetical protein
MLIFVKGFGFVLDFGISENVLKYTLDIAEAQVFELRSQVLYVIGLNDLKDVSILTVLKF